MDYVEKSKKMAYQSGEILTGMSEEDFSWRSKGEGPCNGSVCSDTFHVRNAGWSWQPGPFWTITDNCMVGIRRLTGTDYQSSIQNIFHLCMKSESQPICIFPVSIPRVSRDVPKLEWPSKPLHQDPLGGKYHYTRIASNAITALWVLQPTGVTMDSE